MVFSIFYSRPSPTGSLDLTITAKPRSSPGTFFLANTLDHDYSGRVLVTTTSLSMIRGRVQ